jgi:UrcA family protein
VLKRENGRAFGGAAFALVVACALTLSGGKAFAAMKVGADGRSLSKTLRYEADVLGNPLEAQKLYRRLQIAARQVCRRPGEETFNPAANSCEIAAIAAAVVRVDHVSLTALHRAHRERAGGRALNAWLMSPTPCAQCA